MILEIAVLSIKPDKVEQMKELYEEVMEYLEQGTTPGYHSFRLMQAIEDPNRFILLLTWDTLEDHAALGASELGEKSTRMIAECVTGAPVVHHYELVDGFSSGALAI